jgi:Glycosyl hydrolases family 2, sugar binding domain/Glycosyl hydrolases family 2/Glycosyl hydrolases family 2, TIM barrel domain
MKTVSVSPQAGPRRTRSGGVSRRDILQAGLGLAVSPWTLNGQIIDWRAALKSRLINPRLRISLNGEWAFMPANEVPPRFDPRLPSNEDHAWPSLNVPSFWNPLEWENNSPEMGTSWRYLMLEQKRVASLKFDGFRTRAGWYRRWIDVPSGLSGKRFVVRFNGVARVAQVWWNGRPVGWHIGMFGPFECDVTPYVEYGRANLMVVFVANGQYVGAGSPAQFEGSATAVDLTREVLNRLPRGGYPNIDKGGGGIWQGVELVITATTRIEDVFFNPRLDGGILEVRCSNHGTKAARRRIVYRLVDAHANSILHEDRQGIDADIPAGGEATAKFDLTALQPRHWWPEEPNCYYLYITMHEGRELVDQVRLLVGFRTFEVRGERFYLNEEPYFLRGGNVPPYGLGPNKRALARKFIGLMHEGNQFFTRFHHTAANDIWLDACDRIGVGACIEGVWPNVMWGASLPSQELVDYWHRDQLEVFKSLRNHPSVLMWDINNEWRFQAFLKGQLDSVREDRVAYYDKDRERRLKKWDILSRAVKDTRQIDRTRPVVCTSGYARVQEEYENDLKPRGIDDGDIDDIHVYNGTYGPSVFNMDIEKDLERYHSPERPLISLEASTGYPNMDTGYLTDLYIDREFVAQAWVGFNYVYDESNPILKYNAVITKEYFEKVRRRRNKLSGWVIFGNENWFRHPYDPDLIEPYPTYFAAKLGLSPVLISLDSMNRHFEVRDRVPIDVYVVHDDVSRRRLESLRLLWAVLDKDGNIVSEGEADMPPVDYDSRAHRRVIFEMPSAMPSDRNEAALVLKLWREDELISENEYAIVVAKPSWYRLAEPGKLILVGGDKEAAAYLESIGIKAEQRLEVAWGHIDTALVVVCGHVTDTSLGNKSEMQSYISKGGKVLFIEASSNLADFLPLSPHLIAEKCKHTWDPPARWGAEYLDVAPKSPLSLDIVPVDDMRWWNTDDDVGPRLADVIFEHPAVLARTAEEFRNVRSLASYLAPHGYLKTEAPPESRITLDEFRGSAVIEWPIGKGKLVASTLRLADDPIARKVLSNTLRYLAS